MGRHTLGRFILAAMLAAALLLPSAALAATISYTTTYGGDVGFFQTEDSRTNVVRHVFENYTEVSSTPVADFARNYNGDTLGAYELSLTVNGEAGYTGYCAEYNFEGIPGGGYTLTAIDQVEQKYQQAAYLIANYGNSGDGDTITALQAAVWALTTDQTSDTNNYDEVIKDYGSGDYVSETGTKTMTTGWFISRILSSSSSPTNSAAVLALYDQMMADLAGFSLDGLNDYYLATNQEGQNLVLGKQSEIPGTPEPATMLLLGSGLAGLGAWRKRRRS